MKFPVKYQTGISGTAFDGLQKFSTSKSDSFAMMEFDPTGYEHNVVISQLEADVNFTSRTNHRRGVQASNALARR